MHTMSVAVMGFLLMLPAARAEKPDTLETPEVLGAQAQIDAAREAERQLEQALTELRKQRGEFELSRQGRTAEEEVEDLEDVRIVNGVATIGFPNVGALLKGASSEVAGSWCTGTLVGCRLFLTANHCVAKNRNPASYHVYFQNVGFIDVEWISPQHRDYVFPHADLALLRLANKVDGIPVGAINRSLVVPDGMAGTLIGFGRTGGLAKDPGIKRLGAVKTAACDRPEKSLLCWDYNAPVGLPGTNSNTCNADSGGPLWIQETSTSPARLLAGVTSGGTRSDCLTGDHSYDVDVRQFADWIVQQGGGELGGTDCGSRPLVGSDKTSVLGKSRELSIGEFQDYRFKVPSGTGTLVVSMNGTDNSGTNFNLFVRQGSPATATVNDCAQNQTGNYGVCIFDKPAAGDWYARVDQQGQNKAKFQLVVTLFSEP